MTTAQDVHSEQADGEVAVEACGASGQLVVGGLVSSTEKQVNDRTAADQPDVHVTQCSLRLALLASRRNATAGTADTDRDHIVFDPKLAGTPIEIDGRAPLPPIVESRVWIDGCGNFPAVAKSKPCIDVKLPDTDAVGGFLSIVPGATLPEDANGLTVLASQVKISGLAFQNGNPAIWVPPGPSAGTRVAAATGGFTLTNSWFGIDTTGKAVPAPVVSVLLNGDFAMIGGVADPAAPKNAEAVRNVFAQSEVGVLIAGGARNEIQGNWFGTGPSGRPLAKKGLDIGVKLTGLGGDFTLAADELDALAGIPEADHRQTIEDRGAVTVAERNVIGGSPEGQHALSAACDGPCNVFASLKENAVDIGGEPVMGSSATDLPDSSGDVVGTLGTRVRGNQFGLDATGAAAPSDESAIRVGNASRQTTIGGGPAEANVVSNSRGPGVAVAFGAGQLTRFLLNTGARNSGLVLDLGDDNFGNDADGPSGGIQAPVITAADTSSVSGTAEPTAAVTVYLVPGEGHVSGAGDLERVLGTATADAGGKWTFRGALTAGRLVTALADGPLGTSEPARNFRVPVPPAPPPVEEQKEPVEVPAPPSTPEPEPGDTTAPTVVHVMGKQQPSDDQTIRSSRSAPINGIVEDPSGISEVGVALGIPWKGAKTPTVEPAWCNFVHIRRAEIWSRPCSMPLYFKPKGKVTWRLKLTRRTRRLIRKSRSLDLYLRVVDKQGNVALTRYTIKLRDKRLK